MGGYVGLALNVIQGLQSISGGQAANSEAKYNAVLMERQAQNIEVQKSIESNQYDRAKGQLVGKAVAHTAKSGFQLSGSPLAMMIDSLTQLQMDKAVGQYNLNVQKQTALLTADQYRRGGKTAEMAGYSNAFATTLKGGYDYSTRYGSIKF
jgi:hypothetical protein